jgi:hypothetical protein
MLARAVPAVERSATGFVGQAQRVIQLAITAASWMRQFIGALALGSRPRSLGRLAFSLALRLFESESLAGRFIVAADNRRASRLLRRPVNGIGQPIQIARQGHCQDNGMARLAGERGRW